jgi:hypothetical protein
MPAFHAFYSEWPCTVSFNVLQYKFDVIVAFYGMNSTISTPFLPFKTVATSFLDDAICFNFLPLQNAISTKLMHSIQKSEGYFEHKAMQLMVTLRHQKDICCLVP